MKNLVRRVSVGVVLVVMAMFSLAGCVIKDPDSSVIKKNVVLLVGGTANEASLNISAIEDEIADVCETCGTITIIQIDGAPYLVDSLSIPERMSGLSADKEKQIISEQCSQIEAIINQCHPRTNEMDVLQALQKAAKVLSDLSGDREIIILSSGLSTAGIDFTKILLETDQSEKLVEYLENEQAIPNLEGIDIVWSLAETVSPQTELYEKHRNNLQADWNAVLEAAGASNITFLSGLSLRENNGENLPAVSVVPIVQPSEWTDADFAFEPEGDEKERVFKYDGDKLSFSPNTAELLNDEDSVLQLFTGLIDYMKENSEYKILLAGTTASPGSDDSLKALSLERAEKIKQILTGAGVSEEQIQVAGLGYDNCLTINDTDEAGNLIESKARQNRAVFVMNIESELAKEIQKNND